jgi:anti-anti-sigma regulatory factor
MNLSTHLQCEEESHAGGRIVRFEGEADFLAVPAVRQMLKRLLGERIPLLIVDLSGVTFLNTPFWAALQRYQLDGHPRSQLALCGMNEALLAAFDINGVGLGDAESGRIAVFDHLAAAIGAHPGFRAASTDRTLRPDVTGA